MPCSVQIVYLYEKHGKDILLAIRLLLYSQELKGFLNCKQKNNWQLFIEIILLHISTGLFFSSPKGEITHQFLIAPLLVQIDLFYEITFSVLIDLFACLLLTGINPLICLIELAPQIAEVAQMWQ